MNTNAKAINENSVAADTSRAFHGVAPFRVIAGRGIVDARGRLVATCKARALLDRKGYVVDSHDGMTAIEADDNAHAIAHALNMSHGLRDAIRDAVATIDASGGISESTLDALREFANSGRLELPPRQPEAFRVLWEMDSDRETPEDAARHAWDSVRRHDSTAAVFDVRDQWGNVSRVDLSECDDAAPRDPNISPMVGDVLPLNSPRLCDPEPRGDGTQVAQDLDLVQNMSNVLSLAREFADAIEQHMGAVPDDITGALVRSDAGDWSEVWLTESARPYDLRSARYVCIVAPDGDA